MVETSPHLRNTLLDPSYGSTNALGRSAEPGVM